MATAPKTGAPEISASQSSKEVTHNQAVRIFDALVMPNVIDKDLADAPAASDGDTYIVATGSTSGDDWDGHADDIAYYSSSGWIFMTPAAGWLVYVTDEDTYYKFMDSAGWTATAI